MEIPRYIRKVIDFSLKTDFLLAGLIIVSFTVSVPFFTIWIYANDLTNKEDIINNNDTGVVLLDKNDKPFFTFYDVKNKTFVPISQIPLQTQQAVVAIEDRDFYHHYGFSIRGIIRSIITDVKNRDLVSGGSTITQQLVKNSLLNPRKNFLRKYQEIILASVIEYKYSKQDILEMYLNSAYFGDGSFGISEAAKYYFNKDISQLTLSESSMLASLLPAPSKYSPLNENLNDAKIRQKIVLQKMLEQKYIDKQQMDQALNEKLVLIGKRDDINQVAPHFALEVKRQLINMYGEEIIIRSGFRVRTSLDLEWQINAQKVVGEQVKKLQNRHASNGGVVVIDPKSGEVNVLVGSVDWFNNNFGKVDITSALRQPGSSFKPIVYSAAFEKNIITPATILKDQPITYKSEGSPPYAPANYDRRFRGQVSARRALSNSLNVPSVEVLSKLGVDSGLEMAKRLGITTLNNSNYGLSLVLGSGEVRLIELTSVYATFANKGTKNDITFILDITDKKGNKIYSYSPKPKQVIRPEDAFLISSILSDEKSRREVFGNLLDISRPAAVKTGTSENYRDSVTIGYTPSLAIGAWVGNNDGKSMDEIAGSLGAAPIWKDLMETFLSNLPIEQFEIPQGIVQAKLCTLMGSSASSSASLEYFIKGTQPQGNCPKPIIATSSARLTDVPLVSTDSGSTVITISKEGSGEVNINYIHF